MLINFTKGNRSLEMIARKDGGSIAVPDFVNQARNRYYYDNERDVLLKECLECKGMFTVAIPNHYGEWEKLDEEIHAIKSGFRERCNKCLQKIKEVKTSCGNSQDEKETVSGRRISKNAGKTKKSIHLQEENLIYVKTRASAKNITVGEALDEIIKKAREADTLYNNMVKGLK